MATRKIHTPLTEEEVRKLKAGDTVYLSGTIYTGRDAAHQRIIAALDRGEPLPFEIRNSVIYYVGPSPAKPGQVIGSAGPTTSGRMDDLTVPLLERGLRGMIGKGTRSQKVVEAMKKHCSVYFAAIGGAGALIANAITKAEGVAYEDLGPEAVTMLEVEDFPMIVVIDCEGTNLYETERKKYAKMDRDLLE